MICFSYDNFISICDLNFNCNTVTLKLKDFSTGWMFLSGCSSVYKLYSMVHRCLQHKAPQYMMDCCYTSDIARRQHLRSAGCRQLFVPQHRRSMFGHWAFSVAGPAAWNSLPDYLRDPTHSFNSFLIENFSR